MSVSVLRLRTLLVACGTIMLALGILGAVFVLSRGLVAQEPPPEVSTQLGRIQGSWKLSHEGNKYEAYEGIPYAQPPVKELRFEPPVPWTEPWQNQIYVANKTGQRCLEYDLEAYDGSHDPVRGEEDCLYLNIYVPSKKESNESLPVLFWIHDGAFMYGHAMPNAQHYLMDHGAIYVSMDYRLGVLGFLSTEDDVLTGNMGLKDQSVALKWVKDHIESFGGDPNRITLVGLSAGGASVHYHYLSPMSRGLFHSGISLSGTALVPWAQAENSREKAWRLGKIMKCPTNNSRVLLSCLKKKSPIDLVRAEENFMPWRLNPFSPFGPIVETSSSKPFLSKSPIEVINSGEAYDVPWITGVVSEEGLYPVAAYYSDKAFEEMNKNWSQIAPHLLDYFFTLNKSEHAEVAQKIRQHYLGDEPITRTNFNKLTAMAGDRLFNVDAEKAALAQAAKTSSPVWFYYYSYRASESLGTEPSNSTDNLGVCHGDDAYLVLGNEFMKPVSEKDHAMIKELIGLWTSFAQNNVPKIGTKDVGWKQLDPQKKCTELLAHCRTRRLADQR